MKNIIIPLLILAFIMSVGISVAQENIPEDNISEIIDDIEAYDGSVGPGSPFYGLKIAFENIDETFTFNGSNKLEKQLNHAKTRISEAKSELKNNNVGDAEKAFLRYKEKIKSAENLVSDFKTNDSTLLNPQKRIVKHRFVIEQMLESNPNNMMIQEVFDDSLKLEDRLERKTEIRIERLIMKDDKHMVVREMRMHGGARVEVKATVKNDTTQVRVEVKFLSNITDRNAIAQEILNKIQLNKDDISNLLKFEVEGDSTRDRLEAEAKVRRGMTEAEADFRFPLNVTNKTDVVNGIHSKLLSLTVSDILNVLEFETHDDRHDGKERLVVKAEIKGNVTQVTVETRFMSEKTTLDAVAQEILDRLKLSKDEVSNSIKIENELSESDNSRNKFDVRIEVKKGITEVRAKVRFQVAATDKDGIVNGVHQKLSSITKEEIMSAAEFRNKDMMDDRSGKGKSGKMDDDMMKDRKMDDMMDDKMMDDMMNDNSGKGNKDDKKK